MLLGLAGLVSACANGYKTDFEPTPVPGLEEAIARQKSAAAAPQPPRDEALPLEKAESEAIEPLQFAAPKTVEQKPKRRPGPRPLVLKSVVGAPGDGNKALRIAMRAHLQSIGAPLAPQPTGDDYLLDALVVSVRRETHDELTIIWRVWSNRTYLGEIIQRNAVPKGALDGEWGDQAVAAAGAARNGVLRLIAEHSRSAQARNQAPAG